MDMFADQSRLSIPAIVYNVTNFTKPAPGQPALLTFDEVATLFHEFARALRDAVRRQYRCPAPTSARFHGFRRSSTNIGHRRDGLRPLRSPPSHRRADAGALVDRTSDRGRFSSGIALTDTSRPLLDVAWHLQRPGRSAGGHRRVRARRHASTAWRCPIPPRYHSTILRARVEQRL